MILTMIFGQQDTKGSVVISLKEIEKKKKKKICSGIFVIWHN